jgi:hypothetical protein
MKPPRLLTAVCIFFLLFSLSCHKTDNPDSPKPYVPEYVTATISGRVTDDANKPVNGANVKIGTASSTTNIDGAFTINDVTIDKQAAFVKVEKDGFFLGTKTIVATPNKNNQVVIQLIPKSLAGNVIATAGGNVTVPSNGGTIEFSANSFVNPNGNTNYTGTVSVSAFFINPEASNFNDIMPGTLRGITTNNQETGLQSFGMMAVELNGASGEKLQLAEGKTATLHFPIPTSLQNEAPATIPLWSLDETTGLWKEEGKATKQGNEYVGTVSHFSFWNCDAPFPVIDFTGVIRNQDGINMEGVEVVISVPANGSTTGSITGNGITNADGAFNGKIPANKTLQLKVYNKCHTLIHSQNIGPFTTTTNLGVITVNAVTSQVTISGTVKNCFNADVTTGFVSIKLENIYYNVPVTNGNFSTTITRCNNETVTATMVAYDQTSQQSGNEVSVPVSGTTVNAGNLVACGATNDTYIRFTLDGVNYEYLPPTDTVRYGYVPSQQQPSSSITYIEAKRTGQVYEDVVIMFRGEQTPGTRQALITDFYFGKYEIQYLRNGSINIEVNEYGPPGGYVTGTFSGTVRDSLGTKILPVNFSFRAKRPL